MIGSILIAVTAFAGVATPANAQSVEAAFREAAMLGCLDVTEAGIPFSRRAGELGFSPYEEAPEASASGTHWVKPSGDGRLIVIDHRNPSRLCSVFLLDARPDQTAAQLIDFMSGDGAPFAVQSEEMVDGIRSWHLGWTQGSIIVSAVLSEPEAPRDAGPTIAFSIFLTQAEN